MDADKLAAGPRISATAANTVTLTDGVIPESIPA